MVQTHQVLKYLIMLLVQHQDQVDLPTDLLLAVEITAEAALLAAFHLFQVQVLGTQEQSMYMEQTNDK